MFKFVFLLSFALSACASSSIRSENFQVEKIATRNLWVKTASGKTESFGSHSGVIKLSKGFLVFDSHANEAAEAEVINAIEEQTQLQVQRVIISHPHDDHANGRLFHIKRGTPVHVHAKALKELSDKKGVTTLTKKILAELDKEDVEVILVGRGHSAADVVLYDRKDRVLYTGDLFVNGYIGYLGEGHFTEWIQALDALLKMNVDVVVPGHGPVGTLADLKTFKNYLQDFVSSTRTYFNKHKSPKGYSLPEQYQSWGAQFFLEDNVARAFELWKKGLLD